jgi:hypothetical protein
VDCWSDIGDSCVIEGTVGDLKVIQVGSHVLKSHGFEVEALIFGPSCFDGIEDCVDTIKKYGMR